MILNAILCRECPSQLQLTAGIYLLLCPPKMEVFLYMRMHCPIHFVGQPPSSEGVSATKLPNGDAQVTCADSDVVCLVLFQSTISLDRVLVALIDSFASSTSFSVSDTFANGHVIVYTLGIAHSSSSTGRYHSLDNSIH